MGSWRDKAQGLGVRLMGAQVVVVVTVGLVIALLVVRTAQEALRQAVLQGQEVLARRAAAEMRVFIEQPVHNLQGLALSLDVERDAWRRQSLLNRLALAMPVLRQICLIDRAGSIQVTSALDANAPLARGRMLPAGYLPDSEELWRRLASQQIYLSGFLLADGQPSLRVGLAVVEGQAVVGALVGYLELYGVWERMDRIRVGQTGYAVLLDPRGRFISHPARQWVYQHRAHAQAAHLGAGEAGTLQWQDEDGVAWIGGYAPVEDLGWTLLVQQRADEAFASIRRIQQRSALVVVLALVGAVLVGLGILRTITRPLQVLMVAVGHLRQGQVPQVVLPARKDELRELGMALVEAGQQLHAQRQTLETTLALAQHLIEDNPLGMAVVDAGYLVVEANRAWAGLFGAGSAKGKSLRDIAEGQQLIAWVQDHPTEAGVEHLQIRTGSTDWRFWDLKVVDLADVSPGQQLWILEDQTQRHQLELHMLQAERLAGLGEMAAGLAHEIKNPLAVMRSAHDLLKRLGPEEAEERDQALRNLREAIARTDRRITALLDFARPAGHEREPVDVRAVLRQLLDLEAQYLGDRHIQVREELQEVPAVYANRDALKDVFLNLLTNAVEAMPTGGLLGLSTRRQGGDVEIEFKDTGVGIPPDRLARIFEPFYSTKPVGQGTGLGLAIVFRQLQEAGGQVHVRSALGQGTAVLVQLPAMEQGKEGW
jgi:signal transduction histidine kinase